MTRDESPWFYTPRSVPEAAFEVLCLPSSGASASSYRGFGELLAPAAEVVAVQLPGRGGRWQEPAVGSIAELVALLVPLLAPRVRRRLVIFGHSFGAVVGFELAHALARGGGPPVALLAVSGRGAPQRAGPTPDPDLPRALLVEQLRRLGGTSEAILSDPQILDVVLPPLRADYRLLREWRYTPGPPLAAPIVAYAGVEDAGAPAEAVRAWAEQTRAGFDFVPLPGGHFYREEGLLEPARDLGRRLSLLARAPDDMS